jgi:hypothetical protein
MINTVPNGILLTSQRSSIQTDEVETTSGSVHSSKFFNAPLLEHNYLELVDGKPTISRFSGLISSNRFSALHRFKSACKASAILSSFSSTSLYSCCSCFLCQLVRPPEINGEQERGFLAGVGNKRRDSLYISVFYWNWNRCFLHFEENSVVMAFGVWPVRRKLKLRTHL